MRAKLAFVALLALGVAAQAKPVPVATQPIAKIADDSAIYLGLTGTMFEAEYFQAPQPASAAGRVIPCRLELHMFEKTRLAQSCH